jgi:hypothetical protein
MLKLSDYIEEKKAAEFFGITARDLRRKIVIDKVWRWATAVFQNG